MKKFVFWLAVISAVGCQNDELPNPTVTKWFGKYQSLRRGQCDLNCPLLYEDIIVDVTKGSTDSTINVFGQEVAVHGDGNGFCCNGFRLSIRNDTLWTFKYSGTSSSAVLTESVVGVKGLTSPLRAGTVEFKTTTSEQSESGSGELWLDVKDAMFGGSIVIDILSSSTAVYGTDYYFPQYSYNLNPEYVSNQTLVFNIEPNVTSVIIDLTTINDLGPNSPRIVQLQISDRSVGITPSQNRNHSITIVDDDVTNEPSTDKIIFTGPGYSPPFQLYDINSDGSGIRQRTYFQTTGLGTVQPNFSPDGKRVVFVSDKDAGHPQIYIMNFGGGALQRVTKNDWPESSPSFSKQGDKIIFVRNLREFPQSNQIFSMNVDGTGETQLSHIGDAGEAIVIENASISPDGTQILFTSNLGNEGFGNRNYLMNADGSNVRRLSDKFRSEEHPRFSPDGQKIIFTVFEAATGQNLYIVNADASDEKRVFSETSGLWSRDAEWSPDGTTILFQGTYDPFGTGIPNFSTYTSKIDGSNLKRISGIMVRDGSWSPGK